MAIDHWYTMIGLSEGLENRNKSIYQIIVSKYSCTTFVIQKVIIKIWNNVSIPPQRLQKWCQKCVRPREEVCCYCQGNRMNVIRTNFDEYVIFMYDFVIHELFENQELQQMTNHSKCVNMFYVFYYY